MISVIHATSVKPPPGVPSTIGEIVTRALPVIAAVAGVVLFGLFIYGGFAWLTSAGDANKVKSAQGIMVNAIIGIVIIFASVLLVRVFGHIIGYEGLGIF